LAGSAFNSAYAASKAFDLVLGESLWAEWRDRGVDVLSVIGPAIDTPTFRRTLSSESRANLPAPMDPAVVVEQVLERTGTRDAWYWRTQAGAELDLLLTRRDRVVTKEEVAQAWSSERAEPGGNNSIEVYIHRVRRKLEGSGLSIRTVRGLGYLLEALRPA
jgi:NAD(P)-dependent dehydrogenase (short-subunit alcohol dehydrogenase family)